MDTIDNTSEQSWKYQSIISCYVYTVNVYKLFFNQQTFEYLHCAGTELTVMFVVNAPLWRDLLTPATHYQIKYSIEESRAM